MPHELGTPEQVGASVAPALAEAKTDSFLVSRVEPQ